MIKRFTFEQIIQIENYIIDLVPGIELQLFLLAVLALYANREYLIFYGSKNT